MDICWGCPVQFDCLEHALRLREPHGIWGGFEAAIRLDTVKRASGHHDYAAAVMIAGGRGRPRNDGRLPGL